MKSVLQSLYDGELLFGELPSSRSPEEEAALEQVIAASDELRAMVGDIAWQKHQEIERLAGVLTASEPARSFIQGFRLGARVMVEVLT